MIARLAIPTLFVAAVAFAAEEAPAPRSPMKDLMRARIAEDAKKVPETPKTAPATTPALGTATTAIETPPIAPPARTDSKQTASTPPSAGGETKKTKAKKATPEPATVMPKIEVKKGRITKLDVELAKQEQDIERERKNLKSSEVDNALNDPKVARPLSILGGESTQFRKHVANERVELMEAEKDLTEAIAFAKTKEEKAELEKQREQLRAMRRELDKTLR